MYLLLVSTIFVAVLSMMFVWVGQKYNYSPYQSLAIGYISYFLIGSLASRC